MQKILVKKQVLIRLENIELGTMIALDEQIFSGTVATVGYLNKQYNDVLNSYLESINYDSDTIFMLGNQYFLMRVEQIATKFLNLDDTDLKKCFCFCYNLEWWEEMLKP